MSAKVRAGWELQWQPANGSRARNLVVTWRAARNGMLALGVCGIVLVGGSMVAGRDGSWTRGAISAARLENAILKARQDDLRERASTLLDRLQAMNERGAPISATRGRGLDFAGANLSVR